MLHFIHQDTAGSERYESITRMYYRGAWAAIVCFDLTDHLSFQRTEFWINDLRKIEPVRAYCFYWIRECVLGFIYQFISF